jgi:hypothetical protein
MKTFSYVSRLILCLAAVVLQPMAVEGQSPDTGGWISQRMLNGLTPAVAMERQAAGAKGLPDYRGSLEVFILALASRSYLEQAWANPGGMMLTPLSSASPGNDVWVGGRNTYVEFAPEGPITMTMETGTYECRFSGHCSPLVLDMNGDGVAGVDGGIWQPHPGGDLTVAHLVPFDIDGDGFVELTEWVDHTDGLLVLPETPGKVVVDAIMGLTWSGPLSGRDLLGTAGGWRNGFDKLTGTDDDCDGAVSGKELDGLYVWIDIDRNAVIDAWELSAIAETKITALKLPAAGEGASTFTRDGATFACWDWWPNYVAVKKLPAAGTVKPPERLNLQARVVPDITFPYVYTLPFDEEGWVTRRIVEENGIDWNSVQLLLAAPDGSSLILYDREPMPSAIAEGLAIRLWVLRKDVQGLLGRRIPMPLGEIAQAVFETPESIIVVGDGGARIVHVDLTTGELAVYDRPAAGKDGFRAGPLAMRSGGEVLLTGYFYNGHDEGSMNVIARYEGPKLTASLVPAGDLDAMEEAIRGLGKIIMGHVISKDVGFFLIEDRRDAAFGMAASYQGTSSVIEKGVRLGVLTARGTRVLYLSEGDGSRPPEAVVYDIATKERFSLGRGEYLYPYLEDGGRVAFLTTIDWTSGAMTFYKAEVGSKSAPAAFFTTPGIGAVRVSQDGAAFAYLGPRGLYFHALADIRAVPFVRGNANASPLSSEDPQGSIDIADAVFLLSYLFADGKDPPCADAADANDSGGLDIADPITILTYLFASGGPLPEPFSACGFDSASDDELDCASFPSCP